MSTSANSTVSTSPRETACLTSSSVTVVEGIAPAPFGATRSRRTPMDINTAAPVIVDRRRGRRPRRIVWGGPAQGIVAVHVWTLEPREDGVLVHTEESWEGEPVSA